jgi:hypothetical protein
LFDNPAKTPQELLLYLMPWASNNGGEHGPRGVIPGESGLAHTGSIVNNQSGNFVVTHFELVCNRVKKEGLYKVKALACPFVQPSSS